MKTLMCADGRLPEEQTNMHSSIRMNWVVTADESGRRQLRMCWRLDRESPPAHRHNLAKIAPVDSKEFKNQEICGTENRATQALANGILQSLK